MATNIGTLTATVGVDTRPLKKGLKSAEKQTKDSTKKMLSHWKSLAVGVAATFVLYKMARLVKQTALAHARFETLGIVMTVVGKNAGYSARQMEGYSKALQKTGISMIESRQSLTRMAMAQLDLNKATILGRIAQDAAVIGAINSSEAFQRMIYGIQSGRVLVLKTIGINVNFARSYMEVAKATGRTTASFTEIEKAIIRQNVVIKYGARIAGTYEAAMTTAGKKLTSFTRYVDDFKVKMGKAFGPATVMLVDAATEAMKQFQEEISKPEAQEALRNLSSQLATTIIQLGEDLPKAIEKTTNAIAKLNTLYDSLKGEGIVGAAGVGLIGRILFGSWGPAGIIASMYMTSAQLEKAFQEFEKNKEKVPGILKILEDIDAKVWAFFAGKDKKIFKGKPNYISDYIKWLTETEIKVKPLKFYPVTFPEAPAVPKLVPIPPPDPKIQEAWEKAKDAHINLLSKWFESITEMAKDREQLEKEVLESFRTARMTETELALDALDKQFLAYDEFVKDKDVLDAWYIKKHKEVMEAKNESMTESMKNAMQGWANSFSSTLNEMLWGAEFTFKGIAESFARMITQMMIQKQIIEPMFGGGGSKSWISLGLKAAGTWLGGLGTPATPTGGLTYVAKGGIFSSGISAYSNQIVSKPTQFAFARGAGLMGEGGPEAIMPLTRTPGGDLGVKTEGEGGTTIVIIANDPKSFADMMNRGAETVVEIVGDALKDRTGLRDIMRETL